MQSQQAAGSGASRAVGMGGGTVKRDGGPNWVMIAGGALVMALGIALGRKQIQVCQGAGDQNAQPRSRTSSTALTLLNGSSSGADDVKGSPGPAHDSESSPGMMKSQELFDDNFSSPDGGATTTSSSAQELPAWTAPRVARPYWGDSSGGGTNSDVSPQCDPQFELKPIQRSTSSQPAASKQRRQDHPNPRDGMTFQPEYSSYSSPALRAGLAARREMVHQLRKQLRIRDSIIFDLQAQVSDQDQVITMQRAQTADLQARLTTTHTALRKSNHEIQRLRKELRISPSGRLAFDNEHDNSENNSRSTNSELRAMTSTDSEARMVNDKVKRLQGEKQDMESQVQAFSRECELLFRKASALEAERVQLKKLVTEKGHLLEVKEQECTELSTALANLRSSADIGNADRYCAGDLVRSYNTLFRQSPSRLDMSDGSVSKPGSRSIAHGFTACKSAYSDGSPNYDGPDDESVTRSVVWSLQQEVYELSEALACRSKAVSERKLETSRVLTEFQATQTPSLCGPEETYDWEDLSQVLSFSHDGTSVEQLQELSHKLEKVAKQQQVEDEIEALCRHQEQIRALKIRLTKLIAKCNAENFMNDGQPFNESAHRMAGMLLDLADKLDVQDEQVRETTMDIQQLSMSLQLSSPYVPRSKKQELQRMLQGGSRHSYSPVVAARALDLHKDISISPDPPSAKSCYFAQEQKPDSDRSSSRLFDRQISFSSLPNKTVNAVIDQSPGKPQVANKLRYEFQVGAFDPLPGAKARKSWTGKSSLIRKPAVTHQSSSTRSGSKWDDASNETSSAQQPRTRSLACNFSPDQEVTSGFSFRPSVGNSAEIYHDIGAARDNHSSFEQTRGCVVDSNDFQSSGERVDDSAPDRKTSTGDQSSDNIVTPTSDHGKWFSSAEVRIGSPTVSGACIESSRDNLRRFLFKPDEHSSHAGLNAAYTGDGKFEEIVRPSERENCGFDVTDDDDDGNSEQVQIKRLTEKVTVSGSNSTNSRTKQEMQYYSGRPAPGFVGVSPFAARMACVDVKRSLTSDSKASVNSQANFDQAGATQLLSEDHHEQEEEGECLNIASKLVVGKENMRTNALFYSGNQTVSRMISSKDNWEESQSMAAAKDIFRCDRRRWNSFQDSVQR